MCVCVLVGVGGPAIEEPASCAEWGDQAPQRAESSLCMSRVDGAQDEGLEQSGDSLEEVCQSGPRIMGSNWKKRGGT